MGRLKADDLFRLIGQHIKRSKDVFTIKRHDKVPYEKAKFVAEHDGICVFKVWAQKVGYSYINIWENDLKLACDGSQHRSGGVFNSKTIPMKKGNRYSVSGGNISDIHIYKYYINDWEKIEVDKLDSSPIPEPEPEPDKPDPTPDPEPEEPDDEPPTKDDVIPVTGVMDSKTVKAWERCFGLTESGKIIMQDRDDKTYHDAFPKGVIEYSRFVALGCSLIQKVQELIGHNTNDGVLDRDTIKAWAEYIGSYDDSGFFTTALAKDTQRWINDYLR